MQPKHQALSSAHCYTFLSFSAYVSSGGGIGAGAGAGGGGSSTISSSI